MFGALFGHFEVDDLGVVGDEWSGDAVEDGAGEFVGVRALHHGVVAVSSPGFGAGHGEAQGEVDGPGDWFGDFAGAGVGDGCAPFWEVLGGFDEDAAPYVFFGALGFGVAFDEEGDAFVCHVWFFLERACPGCGEGLVWCVSFAELVEEVRGVER